MTFSSTRNPAIKFRGTRRDLKPCWPAAKTYKTGMTARKTEGPPFGDWHDSLQSHLFQATKKAKHKILSTPLFFSE